MNDVEREMLIYEIRKAGSGATIAANMTPWERSQRSKKAAETKKKHKVQSGDTLWAIAERELGSGTRWQEIASANNVTDPRKLQIGTELSIPGARGRSDTEGQTGSGSGGSGRGSGNKRRQRRLGRRENTLRFRNGQWVDSEGTVVSAARPSRFAAYRAQGVQRRRGAV